jgi:hypothetical protein
VGIDSGDAADFTDGIESFAGEILFHSLLNETSATRCGS